MGRLSRSRLPRASEWLSEEESSIASVATSPFSGLLLRAETF
jgi:hypothetical protein